MRFIILCAAFVSATARVCDAVTDCGAVADNLTLASDALSACAQTCGTIVFPAKSAFLISSIDISNTRNLTLSFEEGAGLFATTNTSAFPIVPFFPPMGNTTCYRANLFGRNVSGLTIVGPTSATIDGNGWTWQPGRPTSKIQAPKLLELVDATDVTVQGMSLINSANWHVHVVFCARVSFLNVTVLGAREFGGTDGIDPHGCTDVLIDGAHIDVGDDAIAVTSGAHDITNALYPTSRVRVVNSFLRARNFAIGSGTYANVSDVIVEDSRIGDDEGSAPWAIKIKSHCPFGGSVSNIMFRRLTLGAIKPNAYQQPNGGYAISIYENYGGGCGKNSDGAPSPYAPTDIRNITFKDITGKSAVWAGNPIEGVLVPGGANVSGLHFENVSFGVVSSPTPWVCDGVVNTTAINVFPKIPASCGVLEV
jgi:polygalacturonase